MIDNTLLEQLIIKLAHKDKAAFQELYELTRDAVFGFALSVVRNRADAEDVTHDTYLNVFRNASSYSPMGKPMAWILTIVRNLSYNQLRNARPKDPIPVLTAETAVSFETKIENKLLLETVLQDLAEDERQIVILHMIVGWKHREIAEWMDLPLATVISKYNRSLKKMKDEIEGKEAGK